MFPRDVREMEAFNFREGVGNLTRRAVLVENSPDNPVNVEFSESGFPYNVFKEVLSLSGNTTLLSSVLVVPVGKIIKLISMEISCDSRAFFILKINGENFSVKNTTWTQFNTGINLGGFDVVEGDTITLEIQNKSLLTGNFYYNLIGRTKDA